MDSSRLISRVNYLIENAEGTLATNQKKPNGLMYVDNGSMAGVRSAGLSFIAMTFGSDHPYYKEFDKDSAENRGPNAERTLAILKQIRVEIDEGWLTSLRGLVAADIFTGFLDMSEHLLEQGYKTASAVTAGSALESHLKLLAESNGIDTEIERGGSLVPKKADLINSELTKNDIYTKVEQKMVTAWLGIRNEAAHGNEDAFTADQVKSMLAGLPGFLSQYSIRSS